MVGIFSVINNLKHVPVTLLYESDLPCQGQYVNGILAEDQIQYNDTCYNTSTLILFITFFLNVMYGSAMIMQGKVNRSAVFNRIYYFCLMIVIFKV